MEGPTYAVKEAAKSVAVEIVLHIAVIGVIEKVEGPKPNASVLFFYG